MRERSTWAWFAGIALLGCGSQAHSEDGAATESEMIVTSTSGLLRVSARTLDDEPPVRGANPFDIEVIRADDGAAMDGLSLTVTPWMPAMGHGTSVRPTVTAIGDGGYRADNVFLFMPGLWELRVSITGSVQDDAAPRFQIR